MLVYITNKGIHMNTKEKFYIYKEPKLDTQINDKNTVMQNSLLDVILQYKPGGARGHSKNYTDVSKRLSLIDISYSKTR